MTTVKGFSFAARSAGIRKSGRLDLGLIFSSTPARCAGVFTTNKVQAAPILVTAPRFASGLCQAVLVNSGNANACTGEPGLRDAEHCSRLLADSLGIDEKLVAVSSTGVIGQSLPMPLLVEAIPKLPAVLSADAVSDVATAIMTTDSYSKLSSRQGGAEQAPYTVLGVAKGAGMIHPNMATMLAFVMTDACIEQGFLQQALRQAVAGSFNIITVDRDTSTNDMVLVMANGEARTSEIVAHTPAGEEFVALLQEVLLDLAKMIVRDGEGATKLVHVQVSGAVDAADARQVAYSVATSNLVKTAFFGEDANWGRIIAAVGYSGAQVDPTCIDIFFDDVPVVQGGLGTGPEREAEATAVLKQDEFSVKINLGLGEARAEYYTSDLTYEYIKINADYRT